MEHVPLYEFQRELFMSDGAGREDDGGGGGGETEADEAAGLLKNSVNAGS